MKNSVEAYIGCLSGAIMKDDYLNAIKSAGFKEVKIIDETHFPIELMASDSTAKALIEEMKIPMEKLKDVAKSVVSIKVQGIKPA